MFLKLHLDDKIGAINNSQLEDSVKEIKNCKDCKGLYFCKNKVMGHYLYPKKTSNILDLVYVPCKYKKENELRYIVLGGITLMSDKKPLYKQIQVCHTCKNDYNGIDSWQ